jgi:F0F1-type ATP synthase membrane subunit b/b'
MDIQIDGRSLADIAPAAAEYFKTADTLKSLGIVALAGGIGKMFEGRIKALEDALRQTSKERDAFHVSFAQALKELEEARAKLSRPKAGRQSLKKNSTTRRQIPEDADETTQELMEEAYNGKKPHSKSEMRRLALMKEGKNNE